MRRSTAGTRGAGGWVRRRMMVAVRVWCCPRPLTARHGVCRLLDVVVARAGGRPMQPALDAAVLPGSRAGGTTAVQGRGSLGTPTNTFIPTPTLAHDAQTCAVRCSKVMLVRVVLMQPGCRLSRSTRMVGWKRRSRNRPTSKDKWRWHCTTIAVRSFERWLFAERLLPLDFARGE